MEELGKHEQFIRAAIARFMATLERDPADGLTGLRELALALDNLVAVYFRTEEVHPVGEACPPAKEYPEFYRRASKAFPELGYYPCVYPGDDPSEEKASLADATDHLADIAGDLVEVLWHFDNSTPEEAIWDYRFGYQHHWGDHLHSLRNYLHSSRIAAW